MRALLDQVVEWFLDLHTLAKVAWIMSFIVVLLFVIPWFFGESLVKGDPKERTQKAAKTLKQLESLGNNQSFTLEEPKKRGKSIAQRRADERRARDDDNNDDSSDSDTDSDSDSDDRDN